MWRLREHIRRVEELGLHRFAGYVAAMLALVLFAGWAAVGMFSKTMLALQKPMATPVSPVAAARDAGVERRVILTQDDWHERLRTKEFWSSRQVGGNRRPDASTPRQDMAALRLWDDMARRDRSRPFDSGEETYRTMCVRLCDGYFWPVSFATTRDNFARDEATCERSCGSPARLYVYRNPGKEPDEMATPDGEPYTRLPAAFLFRTKYDAQCRCTAQPWDKEALDRHRVYALEAARQKGDRTAAQQLADLRKQQAAERQRQIEQRQFIATSIRTGAIDARKPRDLGLQPRQTLRGNGAIHAVVNDPPARPAILASAPTQRLQRIEAQPGGWSGDRPIIMRLGGGNVQQDLSQKESISAGRARQSRRDRAAR